jgi:putative transposase
VSTQSILRYSFRLRPGSKAVAKLESDWDCCRAVWNHCVSVGNESYELFREGVEHEKPTFCRMSKRLTDMRAEFEWLRAGPYVPQQQTVRKWAAEHQAAFKQPAKGWPKFKSSKVALPSLQYTTNGFKIKEGRLCLAGGITIPVVWSRELPSVPKTVTVTRDCAGHWYASFVVRRDNGDFPEIETQGIGIDWGVSRVAITDQGPEFDLECGNQIANTAGELKKAQRKLSRATKGSNGRAKACKAVARLHLKRARQRRDRAFKWARKIVSNFSHIAIEDFKPKFLAKSTMAKKASDGAVGMTKQILETMAEQAGRTVALVCPAYTTMTCASCGTRAKQRLELKQRTFECACGYTAGRDLNAARVILAKAGFDLASAESVRPKHSSECTGLLELGIPFL